MSIEPKPPAEFAIDEDLVRALLMEQHPDLADRDVVDFDEGWDNRLYRLGEDLAVRMPRRAIAVPLIEKEQRWLPVLAPRLPLPVPAVRRVGQPGCGYPWPWSITTWLPGRPATGPSSIAHPEAAALALGQFLRALHQPAPSDAPHNPWRSVPLAARRDQTRVHLRRVGRRVDQPRVLAFWEHVVATPAWSGSPSWIHGDLHPGNLLLDGGRLSAVVDFGDLAAGDPATDLSVMWMLLPRRVWPAFLAACGHPSSDTVMRARGWAVALSLAYIANSRDDDAMGELGVATIESALSDG